MAEEVGNAIQDRENTARDRDIDQVLCPKTQKPHAQLTEFTFSLPHLFSLPIYSIYSMRMCHPLCHLLPITICHLLFAICHSPFALCHALATTLPPVDTPAITCLTCNASVTSPNLWWIPQHPWSYDLFCTTILHAPSSAGWQAPPPPPGLQAGSITGICTPHQGLTPQEGAVAHALHHRGTDPLQSR